MMPFGQGFEEKKKIPKRLCELLGSDWLVAMLQFVENPLQRQRNTL